MDEDQQDHRGHPVLTGLATAIGFTALISAAYSYLARSSSDADAQRILRHMARSSLIAIVTAGALICAGCVISYASMPAAFAMVAAAVILLFAVVIPQFLILAHYARLQARYLGQHRFYLRK